MEIFQKIQTQYAILGVVPPNQSSQKWSTIRRYLFGFSLFVYLTSSQFLYIIHVVSDFMEYVELVCAIGATLLLFFGLAAVAYRKATLFEIINRIEKLIATRFKYPKSKAFFLKTNRQVERLSEIIFMLIMNIGLPGFILPKCVISLGVYISTDSGRDSFELPIPTWFPFDTKNPIGYLIAVMLEYIILGYEFSIIACTLALCIGSFWFVISATKEFKRVLHLINAKAHKHRNQSNELKPLFSEYVRFHGTVLQTIHDFSDLFQPILMALFTWSLISISAALLIIHVEILLRGNIMSLFINATLDGIFGLIVVFIACELGQRMTNAFNDVDFTVCTLDCYSFPIEIQRMLPMIIAIAQRPVELECFGSITCTRDTFKNINHCAFSYFMVLRQLGD